MGLDRKIRNQWFTQRQISQHIARKLRRGTWEWELVRVLKNKRNDRWVRQGAPGVRSAAALRTILTYLNLGRGLPAAEGIFSDTRPGGR